MEAALYKALDEVNEPHFEPVVQSSWRPLFRIICKKMMRDDYEHLEDLAFLSQKEQTHKDKLAVEVADIQDSSIREKSNVLAAKLKHSQEQYASLFRNEVDFHHSIAYRFEKAYRLEKSARQTQQTVNLEIIQKIGDFTDYIRQDSMSLFYILYFCIYFKNKQLVPFVKDFINKADRRPKTEKLLEYLDTFGIDKLRDIGEPINNIVYHMVLYQAIDDKLRVVYF